MPDAYRSVHKPADLLDFYDSVIRDFALRYDDPEHSAIFEVADLRTRVAVAAEKAKQAQPDLSDRIRVIVEARISLGIEDSDGEAIATQRLTRCPCGREDPILPALAAE
ncbi:MAG: hypothetical protein AAGC81_02270 [Pseudomonadota bacterium]